jgi:FtsP/CotA-like multicopper oxidase with cupredoxin domain
MTINRRSLLKFASVVPIMSVTPRFAWAADEKADYTLRIGTGLVELAPEHIVSTTLYNDQFPGPLLRFKQGQRVVVDVHNDTDTTLFVKISLVAGGRASHHTDRRRSAAGTICIQQQPRNRPFPMA